MSTKAKEADFTCCCLQCQRLLAATGIERGHSGGHVHLPKYRVRWNLHKKKTVWHTEGRLLLHGFPSGLRRALPPLASVLMSVRLSAKNTFFDDNVSLYEFLAHRRSVGVSNTEELWPIKTVWQCVVLERKVVKDWRHSLRSVLEHSLWAKFSHHSQFWQWLVYTRSVAADISM